MTPYYQDDLVTLWHGDCVEVMRQLPEASVDAVVTDPPYGLEFMGKDWDAPWKGKPGRDFNELESGSLGGFTQLPNHSRVNNVKCAACERWKFSSNPCRCERPDFPNARLDAMLAFQLWSQAWATEALRILKPGGHLLAFGGTRTWHRLAVAIEDAGFEVRDSIAWMYGSGFPKSLDVSKAIDKNNGEVGRLWKFTAYMRTTGLTAKQLNDATGTFMGSHYLTDKSQPAIPTPELWQVIRPLCGDVPAWVDDLVARIAAEREVVGKYETDMGGLGGQRLGTAGGDITAPATPAAQQWQGWGTALKPAFEPIVVARKPLIGTVAENVLAHGTGALNIDGCRIGYASDADKEQALAGDAFKRKDTSDKGWSRPWMEDAERVERMNREAKERAQGGRWPANVILDESQAAELDRQSGSFGGQVGMRQTSGKVTFTVGEEINAKKFDHGTPDFGGASRFFYVPKAGSSERPRAGEVAHPTVKPLDLMRYLVKLVTPPGGTVLEPFAGSGTTLEACLIEGFQVIGIELTEDYLPLITQRITKPIEQVLL